VIQRVIEPHVVSLVGSAQVRRVLPRGGKGVGPFFFLDHFGPWPVTPGSRDFDVAPHPHIGLSTLTYLFEGQSVHRDSLGSKQLIVPGDVNWMTAGRGIVHSERISSVEVSTPFEVHGLQAWVALPESEEDCEPRFEHCSRSEVPSWSESGVSYKLLAGESMGKRSGVQCYSRLFYVHFSSPEGGTISFDPEGGEIALYPVKGEIEDQGQRVGAQKLAVFAAGVPLEIAVSPGSYGVLLGGEFIGPRQMEWNFVSTSDAKLERAKAAWKAREFGFVKGDDEWIPLPTA